MDLIPIRIPGKNKRDNRKAAIAERQALVGCLKHESYMTATDMLDRRDLVEGH
jgi:hypothetical protein